MSEQPSKKSKHKKFRNVPKKHSVSFKKHSRKEEKVVFPQQKQFPNIYRWITEKQPSLWRKWKTGLLILLFFLMGAIIYFSANIFYLVSKDQFNESRTVYLHTQFAKWQTIVHTYPNYASGYVQLAAISYDLGNKKAAKVYIEQALQYDPNNGDIQKMAKEIGE